MSNSAGLKVDNQYAASTRMPHSICMHLPGSSGLRPPPSAGDAGLLALVQSGEPNGTRLQVMVMITALAVHKAGSGFDS